MSCDLIKYFSSGKKLDIEVVKIFITSEQSFYPLIKKMDKDFKLDEKIICDIINQFKISNDTISTLNIDIFLDYFKDSKHSDEMLNVLLENDLPVVYLYVVNKYNIIMKSEHLLKCCKIVKKDASQCYGSISCIEFILDHKIIPTEEHFKETFNHDNCLIETISRYIDYNYIFQLFIEHGYVPTLDNVKKLVLCRVAVHDFYKYHIVPDKELYDLCFGYGYNDIVFDYFKDFKVSQEDIEELFKLTHKLEVILNILKYHICKLNKKCLENAKILYDNKEVIDYLITEHGITE
jgi:hypothetical protein